MTSAPYDMSLLSNSSTTPIDMLLVFNYWTDGFLFTGGLIVFVLIILAGSMYAQVELKNSLIYASFFGFIVSTLMWLFRYLGNPTVPTLIPVLFIFFLAGSILFKTMKGSISQVD